MAGPKKGRDTEARNATVAPLQPKSDIRSFFTKRPQSPAQHETMSPKKPKIEQDTMSMSMLSTSLSLPSISSNNSTRVLASKLVESKSMPSLKPINASQNSLVPVTKLLNHQGAPDDPDSPKIIVVFRESGNNKYFEIRDEHFASRARRLVQLYHSTATDNPKTMDDSSHDNTAWTLIKQQSSNTDFTNSKSVGVIKLRQWLMALQKAVFMGRVVIILSQVDGFSTNASSLKTVFNFRKNLDLWLFFVHEAHRHSLLHFQTLQGFIFKIEEGTKPQSLVQQYPAAMDYLITLMFMSGAGINKRNVSLNFQAQKQLGIGQRNNFDLDEKSVADEYQCPQCPSTFGRSVTLGHHIKKEHGQGAEIDDFAKALGLCPELPVTPDKIHQVLSSSEVKAICIEAEVPQLAPSKPVTETILPGLPNVFTSAFHTPIFQATRLIQPTAMASSSDRTRVYSRPSDDQISHLVLQPPSSPGANFTLSDDVRIIRLKENEGLAWKVIATHFPGRDWKCLQKRYATKLKKVVRNHRPDELSIRALQGRSSCANYTRDEDLQIIQGKEVGDLSYVEIARLMPNRTPEAIAYRYLHYLKNSQTDVQPRRDIPADSQSLTATTSDLLSDSTNDTTTIPTNRLALSEVKQNILSYAVDVAPLKVEAD